MTLRRYTVTYTHTVETIMTYDIEAESGERAIRYADSLPASDASIKKDEWEQTEVKEELDHLFYGEENDR